MILACGECYIAEIEEMPDGSFACMDKNCGWRSKPNRASSSHLLSMPLPRTADPLDDLHEPFEMAPNAGNELRG
jgi:hypothetical protein